MKHESGILGGGLESAILGGLYDDSRPEDFLNFLLNRGQTHGLGPLNLVQSLKQDEFIDLLNRREEPSKPPNYLLPGYVGPPPVSEILRGWVDEWLDSGRGKDGQDDPRERTLDLAENAASAAYRYSKTGKISLLPSGDGLALWLDPYPEYRVLPRPLLAPGPEAIARQKLVFFLLSDLRHKLAKCRRAECGTYFVLKHWKRCYKTGTRCRECVQMRSQGTAKAITADVREDAEQRLHTLAAKKFARSIRKHSQWYADPALKSEIAKYLNEEIWKCDELRRVYYAKGRSGITSKWVAWEKNRIGIQAKLKGGK